MTRRLRLRLRDTRAATWMPERLRHVIDNPDLTIIIRDSAAGQAPTRARPHPPIQAAPADLGHRRTRSACCSMTRRQISLARSAMRSSDSCPAAGHAAPRTRQPSAWPPQPTADGQFQANPLDHDLWSVGRRIASGSYVASPAKSRQPDRDATSEWQWRRYSISTCARGSVRPASLPSGKRGCTAVPIPAAHSFGVADRAPSGGAARPRNS
jgi:hypothetical protein